MILLGLVGTGVCVWWRWLRRSFWPAADTTSAFAPFRLQRGYRRLRMVRLGVLFLVVEGILYIPWIVARSGLLEGSLPRCALLTLVCGALAVGLYTRRQRAIRESIS